MNKLIMLVGLPGSGKSFKAKEIARAEQAVIVSTDEIRSEVLGSASRQRKTGMIFAEVYERITAALQAGRHVILDATNLDRDKRMKVLNKCKPDQAECYYFDTPFEVCRERNLSRKRQVDERILLKMYKELHVPIRTEGFDALHVVHEPASCGITKEQFVKVLEQEPTYERLYSQLEHIPFIAGMLHFNQENPHHAFPLCLHTYHVLDYVNAFYEEDDKLLLQCAALLHDVGKPATKKFKPLKGYYSYFGHEHVSAQLACHFLTELGFEADFVAEVVGLVQMHMRISYGGPEAESEIFRLLGGDALWKLYFFRDADRYAKEGRD